MSIRPWPARAAVAATAFVCLLAAVPATAAARTATAELRVLTPTQVLDPGTSYVVGKQRITTDPNADCNFGGAGGSGDRYRFEEPVALGLLKAASRPNELLRPLSITDEFGFALAICGIGGIDDQPGTFWYLKLNHEEATVGADQLEIRNRDQFLVYLAPDNFPAPNPKELELTAPPRARPGESFEVSVVEHGCVTDPNTFEVSCQSLPAAGATIAGADGGLTTGADGTASVTAKGAGRLKLSATRGEDIPSEVVRVCVHGNPDRCPAAHGVRVFGRSQADRIRGTRGWDSIVARGGRDRIDIRRGGRDKVDCGPGRDKVLVKRRDDDDRIRRNCERIRRR